MLDKLFKFPIVMVDGNKEEEKERFRSLTNKDHEPTEVDIIIGEAEQPYFDLVGITDRWMPDDASFEDAKRKVFNACAVTFMHTGSFIVPWNKAKFKKKFKEFVDKLPKDIEQDDTHIHILKLSNKIQESLTDEKNSQDINP